VKLLRRHQPRKLRLIRNCLWKRIAGAAAIAVTGSRRPAGALFISPTRLME
jgi:hypothetical protein